VFFQKNSLYLNAQLFFSCMDFLAKAEGFLFRKTRVFFSQTEQKNLCGFFFSHVEGAN